MLALCLMLLGTYYAQNYAGIIGRSLPAGQSVGGMYKSGQQANAHALVLKCMHNRMPVISLASLTGECAKHMPGLCPGSYCRPESIMLKKPISYAFHLPFCIQFAQHHYE